jgi:hypothetical protein
LKLSRGDWFAGKGPAQNAKVQFLSEIQHFRPDAGSDEGSTLAAGRRHQLCMPGVQIPSKETMVRGHISPAGGSSHGFFSNSGSIMPQKAAFREDYFRFGMYEALRRLLARIQL